MEKPWTFATADGLHLAMFGLQRKHKIALAFALCAAIGAARAETIDHIDHADQYSACLKLVHHDAAEAYDSASGWADLGGGSAAHHCAALALIELGHVQQAARRLELLAQNMPEGAALKAGILAQAGQAWLRHGDLERAYAVQTSALALQPQDAEIYLDRAVTSGAAQNYWAAVDDLNQALEMNPKLISAWVYRASAYRYLDASDLAMDDVQRALAIDPAYPSALLERGILHRLAGNKDQARQDWLAVITAAQGLPIADTARANLERLDVISGK